jgi:death-on-curing protein
VPLPSDAYRWVRESVVSAISDRQLAEHGGPGGLRDANGLASALSRPIPLSTYGKPDISTCAAAYAYGLVRNHPFIDGNKRTAWVVVRLFLADNGATLAFDALEAVRIVEGLAAGVVDEDMFAQWLRERLAWSGVNNEDR